MRWPPDVEVESEPPQATNDNTTAMLALSRKPHITNSPCVDTKPVDPSRGVARKTNAPQLGDVEVVFVCRLCRQLVGRTTAENQLPVLDGDDQPHVELLTGVRPRELPKHR